MEKLKRRSEFQAVARGRKLVRPGFVLQALASADPGRPARFGFTVTKKTGNAVTRNRIRRRLREAVRLQAPGAASAGTDYVLIGRSAALTLPFGRLIDDVRTGLAALSRRDQAAGDRSAT